MAFAFKFNLSMSFGPEPPEKRLGHSQGEVSMGSLAQQAAQKLQQDSDSKMERERLASSRTARVRSEAPYLWDKLKEILAEEIGDFNKLGQGNISLKQERITLEMKFAPLNKMTKSEIHVAFDANVPVINFIKFQFTDQYSTPKESPKGRLTFDADPDLTSVGLRYPDGELLTAHQGAEYLFNMLFERA